MNKESLYDMLKKEWRIPYSEKIMRVIHSFSLTEKVLFFFFVVVFCGSGLSLLWQVNKSFLVETPDYGGSLTEGIIGSARFINPVLAISEADRDLTTLVYSGLLKVGSNGELLPDLAESYNISSDGLKYTFKLKNNIYFQDNTKVTADDVIFTIEKAQDTILKSPRKTNWDGVKVEKINDQSIVFTLRSPYSPFIQNMTLGILPKHVWTNANNEEFPFSQYNTKPIGSGPYKIDSVTYTASGLPSEYHLSAFNKYSLGKPYITNLIIKSYTDEKTLSNAYKKGDVESLHNISPKQFGTLLKKSDSTFFAPLPRVFGVFFNQNNAPVFVYKEVRQALNIAVNKQAIVDAVLGGYGQTIDEPVPPKTVGLIEQKNNASNTEQTGIDQNENIRKAQALLVKNGWKQNANGIFEKKDKKNTVTLAFSISTGDAPELKATAQILQKQWQVLGAKVDIKIFELSDLNQNIIRPRKYDSLLFGEIISRDLDLYPFWHSSQRNDPGLNIAMYTNLKADKILESIRKTTDENTLQKLYDKFDTEINNDIPAVFTYSPYFVYVVPQKVHNIDLGSLTTSAERFSNISKWYIETNNVWKIFIKNNN